MPRRIEIECQGAVAVALSPLSNHECVNMSVDRILIGTVKPVTTQEGEPEQADDPEKCEHREQAEPELGREVSEKRAE